MGRENKDFPDCGVGSYLCTLTLTPTLTLHPGDEADAATVAHFVSGFGELLQLQDETAVSVLLSRRPKSSSPSPSQCHVRKYLEQSVNENVILSKIMTCEDKDSIQYVCILYSK